MNCRRNKLFINSWKVGDFFYLQGIYTSVFEKFFIRRPLPDDLFKMVYLHALMLSDEMAVMLPPKEG